MTIQEAKQIKLADYLQSLGYTPVKQQGASLWYKSPFRQETEASFKVNTDLNLWYDYGLGKGGNIIALASELYRSDHVPHLLRKIAEQAPHIRQRGEQREKCLVFEGMTDYLSFLTLRMKNCPTMPDLDRQDYVILNSVANVSKAIDVLHGYGRIHCLLDNDEAGARAYQELRKEFPDRIRDFSHDYSGYKDLNDYLCGKRHNLTVNPPTRTIVKPKKKGLGL